MENSEANNAENHKRVTEDQVVARDQDMISLPPPRSHLLDSVDDDANAPSERCLRHSEDLEHEGGMYDSSKKRSPSSSRKNKHSERESNEGSSDNPPRKIPAIASIDALGRVTTTSREIGSVYSTQMQTDVVTDIMSGSTNTPSSFAASLYPSRVASLPIMAPFEALLGFSSAQPHVPTRLVACLSTQLQQNQQQNQQDFATFPAPFSLSVPVGMPASDFPQPMIRSTESGLNPTSSQQPADVRHASQQEQVSQLLAALLQQTQQVQQSITMPQATTQYAWPAQQSNLLINNAALQRFQDAGLSLALRHQLQLLQQELQAKQQQSELQRIFQANPCGVSNPTMAVSFAGQHQQRPKDLHSGPSESSTKFPTLPRPSSLPSSLPSQKVAAMNMIRSMTPGISLSLACDEEQLSEYQVLIRKQFEVFEADLTDVESNTQGRKKKVYYGQVGLRCRHCASLPLRQRGRGAVYYPAKLSGVYQAAQNMASTHLSESCHHIPEFLKQQLRKLRDRRDTANGGKQYWADGCRMLGLYETDEGLKMKKRVESDNSKDS